MLKFVKIGACLLVLCTTGCKPDSEVPRSVYEFPGDRDQRITKITAQLGKNKVPSAILDAHVVQVRIGDFRSDYQFFYALEVAPDHLVQWTEQLTPASTSEEYVAPPEFRQWWVSPQSFASLKFYKADIFVLSGHGWIGVSQDQRNIYIFTFTT